MSEYLIHGAAVLGLGIVAPLAFGGGRGRWLCWWFAATAAGISFVPRAGVAAGVLTAPFAVAAARELLLRARAARSWSEVPPPIGEAVASAFAMVAAVAFGHSRLGVELGGIGEPIVELTAVHFLFAGVGALTLAARARRWVRRFPDRTARAVLGDVAVVCTACAPPVVAVGFTTQRAVAQVGGAGLMTVGVCCTALLHLFEARALRPSHTRTLLAVSGAAVWLPMVFAVAWAAARYWDVPAFSVATMVPGHGLPNALLFTLGGLLGSRDREPSLRAARPVEVVRV